MALSVPLLSEDQLLCAICLGVFVEPVSTPCGHNFCMSCLSSYWDSSAPVCFCPVCKENFSNRPQLRVNTFIKRLCQSFNRRQLRQEPQTSVLCDVCTAPQQDALMSCVECLSSFCSDHLEPHHRVPGLCRHTLIPPVSLQDRVCPQHHQLLHSYCTEEGALLCASCEGAHSKHKTLPLEQACRELRDQLEPNNAKITSLIQEKVQKIWSIRDTKAQRHEKTRRVIAQSEEVLQDVLKKVQKSHKDLVQKMEEKQQQADSEAEALVVQTEDEIEELLETHTKLQELKQTEDPLIFLQKHPNMSITFQSSVQLCVSISENQRLKEMRGTLKICTTRIKETLQKLNNEISLFFDEKWWALRSLQRHTVDIKLDPETAHPNLRLSPDLKQVSFTRNVTVPANNKKRFLSSFDVVADRGFSSGKFYFEVIVGRKSEWVLGVATESLPRRERIPQRPGCGVWALHFRVEKFDLFSGPDVPVYMGIVERVGVFVDYDKGLVSFYDVKTATCIYSFTHCVFTEKIYPFFGPCDDEFPFNWDPMIIVPVGHE